MTAETKVEVCFHFGNWTVRALHMHFSWWIHVKPMKNPHLHQQEVLSSYLNKNGLEARASVFPWWLESFLHAHSCRVLPSVTLLFKSLRSLQLSIFSKIWNAHTGYTSCIRATNTSPQAVSFAPNVVSRKLRRFYFNGIFLISRFSMVVILLDFS